MNPLLIKTIGIAVIAAVIFGAGYEVKSKFDQAAMYSQEKKIESLRLSLSQRASQLQQSATTSKEANSTAQAAADMRISKLPGLNAKVPDAFITEYNK